MRFVPRRSLLTLLLLAAAGVAGGGDTATPARTVYDAPYAGAVNYAAYGPQFRWGWFGVDHHCDPTQWHRNYQGHPVDWRVYRRY